MLIRGIASGSRNILRSRMSSSTSSGPLQMSIEKKLSELVSPIHLQVLNESHMHNVPKNSETHFKVIIVSKEFESMSLIQRHRLVNKALEVEFEKGMHALSITAKTPSQWEKSGQKVKPSPVCRGGDKTRF